MTIDPEALATAAAHDAGPDTALAGLGGLADVRARLDELEADLIGLARERGATWTQIAATLGLGSRQAAEQRLARLHGRKQSVDSGYGEPIAALRAATRRLHHRLVADPRWDSRFTRAALVRSTVATAVQAPPAALFSLVEQAISDMTPDDLGTVPGPARAALDDLRRAVRHAMPS